MKVTILSEVAHILKLQNRFFLKPLSSVDFKKKGLLINFVCTGNICRSPYAEYKIKSLLDIHGIKNIKIISTGTNTSNGHKADKHAISAAERMNLNISGHQSTKIDLEKIKASDLLVIMGTNNYFHIIEICPEAASKCIYLGALMLEESSEINIIDPYGRDDTIFNYSFQSIDYCLNKLVNNYIINGK